MTSAAIRLLCARRRWRAWSRALPQDGSKCFPEHPFCCTNKMEIGCQENGRRYGVVGAWQAAATEPGQPLHAPIAGEQVNERGLCVGDDVDDCGPRRGGRLCP